MPHPWSLSSLPPVSPQIRERYLLTGDVALFDRRDMRSGAVPSILSKHYQDWHRIMESTHQHGRHLDVCGCPI